ncbi:type II toxin-antitoxin system RelE/ParE family toxin [Lacticaseibacillus suihuaensis]
MMALTVAAGAELDLLALQQALDRQFGRQVRQRVINELVQSLNKLAQFPGLARPFSVLNLSVAVPGYFYRTQRNTFLLAIDETQIRVLRVLDNRQDVAAAIEAVLTW